MGFYNINNRNQIKDFDKIITKYFGETTNGFIVDVGAHDGHKWSNSWPVITAGWSGILIEPHKEFVNQIKLNYKNRQDVIIVEKAVSNYVGKTTLYEGKSLTTIVPKIIDGYKNVSWARGHMTGNTFEVNVDTLDNILNYNHIQPGFEIFTLDCEGSEEQVLECFDIDYWKPKMVIVETLEIRNASERAQLDMMEGKFYEWCDNLFISHEYDKVFVDAINTIYVRKDYENRY